MTPSDLDHGCLPPRASARWYWCEAHPVYTLWRCAREQVAWPHDQPWVGEGVLFVGTADGVCHQPLGKGGHAFLKACAAGQSLMQASELAQHAETDLDFTEMLGRLMTAQAFRPLAFTGEHPHG